MEGTVDGPEFPRPRAVETKDLVESGRTERAKAGYSVVPCILYVATRSQMARICLYRGSMVD